MRKWFLYIMVVLVMTPLCSFAYEGRWDSDKMKLTPVSNATCNAENKGLFYYDSDDDIAYCCNGTGWNALY